jgi:hypothetical protein
LISIRPPDIAWTRSANRCAFTPTPGVLRGQGITIVQRVLPCATAGAARADAAAPVAIR